VPRGGGGGEKRTVDGDPRRARYALFKSTRCHVRRVMTQGVPPASAAAPTPRGLGGTSRWHPPRTATTSIVRITKTGSGRSATSQNMRLARS